MSYYTVWVDHGHKFHSTANTQKEALATVRRLGGFPYAVMTFTLENR